MSTNTKSLVSLSILILCAACAPQSMPTTELSPTLITTQSSLVTAKSTSTATPTPSANSILDVDIDNLAIGPQGKIYASGYGNGPQGLPQPQIAQWDGEKWTVLDTGFQPEIDALTVDDAGHFYAEFFTDSQQGLSNAIMRWDGSKWEDITANFGDTVDPLKSGRLSSNIPVVALAVDGEDNLYAAGFFYYASADYTAEFPMGYVAKWDQDTWTVLGKGFDKVNIYALAVSPTGDVYIAGEAPRTPEGNSSFIARWEGKTWKQLDTSKLKSSGYLTLDKSGGLYVGSLMSEPTGYIDYWDGTNWRTITAQLAGEAPAILDMAVDVNGHLYIAGSFESVNGIPAQYIAHWDGSSWQTLGDGFNKQVNALAFDPSGELYAIGLFTEAGGLAVQHIARWDGKTWHALGP